MAASGKQAAQVHGRGLMLRLALSLAPDLNSGDAPEVISRIFARAVYEQVLFFIDQVWAMVLAHLEIWCELDRIRRAGFFAEAAKNAARKIDAEKLGVAPSGFILRGLEGDAIHGAGHRAEVAGNAALTPVGIARENNAASPAWRKIWLLVRILHRHA